MTSTLIKEFNASLEVLKSKKLPYDYKISAVKDTAKTKILTADKEYKAEVNRYKSLGLKPQNYCSPKVEGLINDAKNALTVMKAEINKLPNK